MLRREIEITRTTEEMTIVLDTAMAKRYTSGNRSRKDVMYFDIIGVDVDES